MKNDSRTQPLLQWNKLAQENTENAIVSSMFEAAAKSSEPVEVFSTWLLVAAAAVASFLITNAEKIVPVISQHGFIVCGAFLCLSCIFGLFSRAFALRCKVQLATKEATEKTFAEHLSKYQEEEKKIQEGAKFWGLDIQTGVRMERVLNEFLAPMPWWVRWQTRRQLKKYANNPQIGHIPYVKSLHAQSVHAFLQTLCFLGFLGSGFVFAAAI